MERSFLSPALLRYVLLGVLLGIATGQAWAKEYVIGIKKMKFQIPELTVKKGDTVRWENLEKRQYHSVWFEKAGDAEPDYIFPGETYERRFDRTGSFPYRCGPHPEMIGIIHVKG